MCAFPFSLYFCSKVNCSVLNITIFFLYCSNSSFFSGVFPPRFYFVVLYHSAMLVLPPKAVWLLFNLILDLLLRECKLKGRSDAISYLFYSETAEVECRLCDFSRVLPVLREDLEERSQMVTFKWQICFLFRQ